MQQLKKLLSFAAGLKRKERCPTQQPQAGQPLQPQAAQPQAEWPQADEVPKRQRRSTAAAVPTAAAGSASAAAMQSCKDCKAASPGGFERWGNPLFETDENDAAALNTRSASPPMGMRLQLAPAATPAHAAGSTGGAACAGLLPAFSRLLQDPVVLSALCGLELEGRHPVGAAPWDQVDATIAGTVPPPLLLGAGAWRVLQQCPLWPGMPARLPCVSSHLSSPSPPVCPLPARIGMLLLARRAGLAGSELTPEHLLTLLWLLESCGDQYRDELGACLRTYRRMHPTARFTSTRGLRRRMEELQLQVRRGLLSFARSCLPRHANSRCCTHIGWSCGQGLEPFAHQRLALPGPAAAAQLLQRCGWRVLLRDDQELLAVLGELEALPR